MATRSLGSLTLDLIAKIGGFEQGMNRAARIAAQAAKKIEDENKRRAAAVEQAWRGVSNVIGGIALAGIGRELIRLGDAYAQLNARISLVTTSQAQLDNALAATFAIAQETRQSFEQTGLLYVRLAQTTEALGKTQSDVLGVTKAINQAFIISGSSAASAAAAIIQLGQGFASGVLRGEELNSVLEQAPRLAKAIADGLGVAVGDLRRLGEAGELTAEKVFNAIQRSQDKLNEEFKKLPPTVEQALTQVGNSVLKLVGQLNQATGATAGLAAALGLFSKGIDFVSEGGNVKLGLLAKQLNDTNSQIKRLEAERVRAVEAGANATVGRIDERLNRLRPELARLRQEFRSLDVNNRISPDNESAAETRRLAGFRPIVSARPAPDNLNALREQLKQLTKLRDEAKIGSKEFNNYGAQIKTVEARIKELTGAASGGARERRDASEQLLESLRDQVERVQELTVTERTLRELQKAEYATISAQRKEEILDAAKLVDSTRARKEAEDELAKAQKQRLEDSRQAAIDELETITRTNTEYQNRIQSLIDATPTAQLEQQRKTVQDLSDEYLRGRFGIVGSEEAVKAYSETVNTFLGNTAEQLEKTKSLGEELGLTFTSAFEDAIVGGKGLGDILTGLEQDILRIVTRKLVTEPLGNALSGALGGLFGGGGGGGGGGGFFGSLFSGLGSILGFKASGGSVAAGGLYRVNERGPELLSVGGKDFLMMGQSGGTVTPSGSSGQTVVNNFSISGPVDRRTEAQIAKAATRGIQRAQRWV